MCRHTHDSSSSCELIDDSMNSCSDSSMLSNALQNRSVRSMALTFIFLFFVWHCAIRLSHFPKDKYFAFAQSPLFSGLDVWLMYADAPLISRYEMHSPLCVYLIRNSKSIKTRRTDARTWAIARQGIEPNQNESLMSVSIISYSSRTGTHNAYIAYCYYLGFEMHGSINIYLIFLSNRPQLAMSEKLCAYIQHVACTE